MMQGDGPVRDTSPCSAMHVVMAWPVSPVGEMDVIAWDGLKVEVKTGTVGVWSFQTTAPSRPRVLTVIWDGAETHVAIDGEVIGTSTESMSNESADVRILPNLTAGTMDVYRVQGSTGALLDILDEASLLAAQYSAPATEVTATGGWAFTTSGAVTVEDVWLPPNPPALVPGGSVEPPEDPEPQDPPAKVKASRIRRVSEVMPVPTLVDGRPEGWKPTSVVSEVVGRLQVIVEGVDITYWGGVETPHPVWSRVEPFGADQATIELPQVTTFSQPGTGDLVWCRAGSNVAIRLVTSTEKIILWRGVVTEAGVREDTGVYTLACLGLLFTADLQLRTPPFSTTPMDVGRAVARALNGVVSRRYRATDPVVTGCKTSVQGGWEPTLTGWVTQMLATAVTDGRQWTVRCESKQPIIELKDTTTVQWTVRAGQRGINVELSRDITQAPNRIFAEGIRPDGGRWRNTMYPNWRDDDTPDYDGPMGTGMTVGWSSPGVRLWQEKAGQPVTGTLSQDDRVEWRRIQAEAGIRVDDYLGPQTWAASFGTGSNTGSLDGAFIAPIASATEVRPDLLGPDGDVLGPNPDYVRDVLPVDRYINYGAGVTKAEGRRASRELLARDAEPGWAGTVTFTMDPNEGSRYMIREGHNIRIRGVQGSSVRVHVERVEVSDTVVTCTVDSKARDNPTLDAILDRERAAVDPARAYRRQQTKGTVSTDRATWDSESPGGKVPKHAVFGGLWNVLRIPFAQYGDIVRSSLTDADDYI